MVDLFHRGIAPCDINKSVKNTKKHSRNLAMGFSKTFVWAKKRIALSDSNKGEVKYKEKMLKGLPLLALKSHHTFAYFLRTKMEQCPAKY